MARVLYRLGQFWRIWRAQPLPDLAWEWITAVLTQPEAALFDRFSLSDRRHSYQVLRTLQLAGETHPDLLAAALLHDVGKTRAPLSIWERSLIVLASKLAPGKTAVWGQGEAQGWKRPFVVKAQHPAWGAAMAQAAGSRPLTVALIRRHQDTLGTAASASDLRSPLSACVTEEDDLLRLLQWADDQN
ncbi:MAG: HD domain-containing protein [Chloroflexi bacterium]|nr:HD domain-containing protein [Chloroflexota bacterium]